MPRHWVTRGRHRGKSFKNIPLYTVCWNITPHVFLTHRCMEGRISRWDSCNLVSVCSVTIEAGLVSWCCRLLLWVLWRIRRNERELWMCCILSFGAILGHHLWPGEEFSQSVGSRGLEFLLGHVPRPRAIGRVQRECIAAILSAIQLLLFFLQDKAGELNAIMLCNKPKPPVQSFYL